MGKKYISQPIRIQPVGPIRPTQPIENIVYPRKEIGTLGDITFTVSQNTILTFDNMKMESKTSYTKTTRKKKKPKLAFEYNDVNTMSFSMYFSIFLGVKPLEMIQRLDDCREKGKALALVVGGEKYGGKWVITSLSKEYKKFDCEGNLLTAKINITLQEYS